MIDIIAWIGAVSGPLAVGLLLIIRNGAQKYVDEKAKNLATIEDIARITGSIETVKAMHLRQSHAWKWIYEKEYEILRDVWSSTWEFQATARSLRPNLDRLPEDEEARKNVFRERYDLHNESAIKFKNTVMMHQPFIPPAVYESCLELRSIVIELQVDFEMSMEDDKPDWRKVHECGKKLDQSLSALNEKIRDHVHGVIKDAEQGAQPDAFGAG